LATEVEVLRKYIDWLQRLERGESVVVNLRPDADAETEFVGFDRPRVVRVLERIAADLDNLSLVPNDPHADKESNNHDPQARHRHKIGRTATEAEETESPRAADGVASSAGTTAKVRKSDRVFRKLNALVSAILGSAATGKPHPSDWF